MKTCIACGEQLENNEDYCLYCGAPQIKVEAKTTENEKKSLPDTKAKRIPKEVKEDSRQQAKQEKERQRRENEERLKKEYQEALYKSTHDPLTDIGNRALFEETLANNKERRCWIVYIDVNDFKEFNDKHSHDTGDTVLKSVAAILSECFDGEAYRIGGDEFAAVIGDISEAEVKEKIEKAKESLLTIHVSDEIQGIKVAAGYSYYNGVDDIQEAITVADKAMYEDKAAQKPQPKAEPSNKNLPYNDNADGYYNDIEPDVAEIEKKYAKISIKRIILLVLIGAAVIIIDQLM